MIDEKIKKLIKDTTKNLGINFDEEIKLEHPADLNYGDYSTNIAMILSKKKGINSNNLSKKIVEELIKNKAREIEKIEAVGGFINFYLSKSFYIESIKEILKQGDDFGKNKIFKKQKTIIEYTDPNPFKEFHIGHLMSNTVGEAIARIFEWNGAEVKRANYQGDVGLHVAKTIWWLKKQNIQPKDFTTNTLAAAYSSGAKSYEENDEIKKEINEVNLKIYNNNNKELNKLYKEGKKLSLEYFENIYKKLGTKFDYYFFESETKNVGEKVVKKFLDNKIFEKSDKAIIFKGEKYGLHTRVFQNSDSIPTYEAKELGLAKMKYDKYRYDKSIIITGNEINDYFKVLMKVMSLDDEKDKNSLKNLSEKTTHIGHGMLRLPTGKMASRTGDVITFGRLYETVYDKIFSILEKNNLINEKEKKDIADKISIATLKYSILKQGIGKDIIFDLEKSISFEGDSGPYLQYTFVRAKSVLEQTNKKPKMTINLDEISNIEKLLYKFTEIVKRAGEEYSPNYIVTYLIEVASAFNSYYANNKILNSENESYRLGITKAVSVVLENGLKILGIKVPEKM